jgi:hypothetical protein
LLPSLKLIHNFLNSAEAEDVTLIAHSFSSLSAGVLSFFISMAIVSGHTCPFGGRLLFIWKFLIASVKLETSPELF